METSICHVRMIFVLQMLSHPYILAAVTFLGDFAKELLQRIHLTTRVNNLKRLEMNQGSVDGMAPDGLGHFGPVSGTANLQWAIHILIGCPIHRNDAESDWNGLLPR